MTAEFTGSSHAVRTTATEITVSAGSGTSGTPAMAGTDFTGHPPITVTIPAEMSSGTEHFPVDGDRTTRWWKGRRPCWSRARLSGPPPSNVGDADDQGQMTTAPTEITLSLNPDRVAEDATPSVAVTAAFTPAVTLSAPLEVTVTVTEGTAEAADFTSTPITITIPAGATSASDTLSLTLIDDTLVEGDETLMVTGAAPGITTLEAVTLTITDSDTAPTEITLSLNPDRVAEGATTPVVVTAAFTPAVTLSAATEVTVSVAEGTAGATEFTASAITVTILAGATSGMETLRVTVPDDTLVEGDETLVVTGTAVGIPTLEAVTLTITDSDTAPTEITLSLNPDRVAEDATPSVAVTAAFTPAVTLSAPLEVTVTVTEGTAEAADFTSTPITITIPAGATSASDTLSLTLIDDTLVEGDETLMVTGAAPGITTLEAVTLTITDSDTAPTEITLSLNPDRVAEGATTPVVVTAAFTPAVTLSAATEVTVSVAEGTAGATEFTASAITVTILAGATSGMETLRVTVPDDTLVEGDETLVVTGTAVGIPTLEPVTLTITDSDTAPTEITLSLNPDRVAEDATPSVAVTAAFTPAVTLSAPLEVTVTVTEGTAEAADFTSTPITITIPAGATSASDTLSLTLIDDTLVEGDETLMVTGAAPGITTLEAVTLTITDSDTAPTEITLSLNPDRVAEGATTPVVVTAAFTPAVTLSAATEVTVSVAEGTAGATEFTASAITVTILAGATSGMETLRVTVPDDTLVEGDETLVVTGTAVGIPTLEPVTLTITDSDTAPTEITLSLNPDRVAEDATPSVAVTAAFTPAVTLSAPLEVTVTVTEGTAEAADFTSTPITITIPAGATSASDTLSLTLIDDTLVEGDETLMVTGAAPGITTLEAVTLTITDSDTAPTEITLSLNPDRVAEGATTPVVVTAAFTPAVTLSAATEVTVSVAEGTAGATEFTASAITVTILAGATSGMETLRVTVPDDTLVEGDETLMVTGAALGITTLEAVTLTITDSDTAPTEITLSLNPDRVAEDATPSVAVTAAFTPAVTLSAPLEVTVTVTEGTAEAADFTSTPITITIPAGATSASDTLSLTLIDDTLVEGDETLMVTGAAPGITTLEAVTLTITDSDTAPTEITLSLNPDRVAEGATTPVVVTAAFTPAVTLSAATEVTVSVAEGTAGATEFTASAITVTILAGATSGMETLRVTVPDDTLVEGDETLVVTGTAVGIPTLEPVTLTITDSDTAPTEITLSLNPDRVAEDATPSVAVTAAFTPAVTLSAPLEVTVTVTEGTAEAADFTSTPITITIPAGATSASDTLSLTLIDDTLVEGDETLMVTGAAPGITTLEAVTLTITDSDTAPTEITLSLNPDRVAEGATTPVVVTAAFTPAVTLSAATEVTVSVAEGTAGATEFTASAITVTILAGATSGMETLRVTVPDDTLVEGDETLVVTGTAVGIPTLEPVTLTITDSDTAPTEITLSLNPDRVAEDATPSVAVTAAFTPAVTLSAPLEVTVTVTEGTAEAADFTSTPITITIPAGATSASDTLSLTLIDDTLVEGDETLMVMGAAPGITTLEAVTLTITDSDTAPTEITLSLNPDRVAEGATTPVVVTAAFTPAVTLSAATEVTVSVAEGTAGATEFTASAITVTILAGATSGMETLRVTVPDDTLVEGDETLVVTGTAVGITTLEAVTLTITDSDTAPTEITLSLNPDRVAEDATPSVAVTAAFTPAVTLSAPLEVTTVTTGGDGHGGRDPHPRSGDADDHRQRHRPDGDHAVSQPGSGGGRCDHAGRGDGGVYPRCHAVGGDRGDGLGGGRHGGCDGVHCIRHHGHHPGGGDQRHGDFAGDGAGRHAGGRG